jgi:hypothetical protein
LLAYLKIQKHSNFYYSGQAWEQHLRKVKRLRRKRKIRAAYQKYLHELNVKTKAEGKKYKPAQRTPFAYRKSLPPKPKYPVTIEHLSTVKELFTKSEYAKHDDGNLLVPETFSLIENFEESFEFLKRLFTLFKREKIEEVIIDYSNCNRIDVDASICMDVILAEFIKHIRACERLGHKNLYPKRIKPINYQKDQIMKVLFSTGMYRNLKGLEIKFDDIEPLPVLINHQSSVDRWGKSEIHLTKIVEYIKRCLGRLGKELSSDAETEFYQVIGEIMSNAEEHSTLPHRFAIGFFQESRSDDEHFGIFNFSILNFGDTIYQTFKSPNCVNQKAVSQMTDLASDYTKKGLFTKAEFEEETLWTLYALQEGVTSKEKKRGNGSIHYIENFFRLKGDLNHDSISKLVLISGNTRILFDGSYQIEEKVKSESNRKYKMITFNKNGEISDKPDKKFVNFAPYFFPGTLISARILIKSDNTNVQTNGNEHI